jgi:holo-[acyl-carrier-protein] synthase
MEPLPGLGIDIISIPRIKSAAERWGDRFLNRIFTDNELTYCLKRKNPYPCLAVRFAAKEAFVKAYDGKAPRYRDIEVVMTEKGRPSLVFQGMAFPARVSLSHERDYAVAVVMVEDGR